MGAEERAEGFTAEAGRSRKIIHIDMDAFYASVEQRDNPELRGKPVAVGGSRERGVVAAASYEARKFGVHSAMPSITAKRKCPDLIFVKPRFDAYKAISLQIREIWGRDRHRLDRANSPRPPVECGAQPLQAVGDCAERVGQVGAHRCDHRDGGDRDQRGDQAVFNRGNAPAVIDQARQYVSHHQLFALRIGWPKLDRNYC